MPKVYDLSVVHDVLLAFQAQEGAIAGFGKASRRHQIIVLGYFGANEPALNVGVNLTRGLQRR